MFKKIVLSIVLAVVLLSVSVPCFAARASYPPTPQTYWNQARYAINTAWNYGSYYYTRAYNYATGLNGQSAQDSLNEWGGYEWVQTAYDVINYQW